MSKIYVSHAFSDDPERNRLRTVRIARQLALEGHLPLVPHFYFPTFIDEAVERELALKLCLQLLTTADEVYVYGAPTDGMRLEIEEARRLGIPVVAGELP